MSLQVRVVHSTGYRYDLPAAQSFNEVRLTPRTDHHQVVLFSRIDTTPATRMFRYTDYWGTSVTSFDLHAPHSELKVVADEREPVQAASWKSLKREAVVDQFGEFLQPARYPPRDVELLAVSKRLRKWNEPVEAVLAASNWVHDQLTYRPGSTGVQSSAGDAWRAREGVCQDYAHITLVLLRAMGIPARYVSGYLHTKPDTELGKVVRAESHAWVEAWTSGWWAHDPTNAIPVGQRHVWVALGRGYADVAPLKGSYSGLGVSGLDVSVEMCRLA